MEVLEVLDDDGCLALLKSIFWQEPVPEERCGLGLRCFDRLDPICTLCGERPTAMLTMAGGYSDCTISWCQDCWDVLGQVRADDKHQPLVMWAWGAPHEAAIRRRGRPKLESQGVRKHPARSKKQPVLPWPDVGGDAA